MGRADMRLLSPQTDASLHCDTTSRGVPVYDPAFAAFMTWTTRLVYPFWSSFVTESDRIIRRYMTVLAFRLRVVVAVPSSTVHQTLADSGTDTDE